jgi:hypothetical protein
VGHLSRRAASRRGGFAIVWLALMMAVFMGVAAMTVDQGFHLTRKSQAQQAADAAALAGAQRMSTLQGSTAATNAAYEYAKLNGYDRAVTSGKRETRVGVTYPLTGNDASGKPYPSNWFMVQLARREPRFFGQVFLALMSKGGAVDTTQWVGATAIAEFTAIVNMEITDKGKYGTNRGNATLSMFGPDGLYSNGDFRSPKLLNDGKANPDYHEDLPNDKDEDSGYNFGIAMDSSIVNAKIELFDPDCYNAPGGGGNQGDAATGLRVDEWRQFRSGSTGSLSNANKTRYRLYSDNGTPANLSDDYVIAEKTYDTDAATDMKWVKAFEFNRSNYPNKNGNPQNFRLNVLSLSGSSENGFNIRAGDAVDNVQYQTTETTTVRVWNGKTYVNVTTTNTTNYDDHNVYPPDTATITRNDYLNNGATVTAQGFLPLNFNKNGDLDITLGYVPKEAAGRELTIRKFDTDVNNGQAVVYTCVQDDGSTLTYTGVLSGNGTFATDKYTLPNGYKGGLWTASYNANIQDTSVWEMHYNGASKDAGRIRLVR